MKSPSTTNNLQRWSTLLRNKKKNDCCSIKEEVQLVVLGTNHCRQRYRAVCSAQQEGKYTNKDKKYVAIKKKVVYSHVIPHICGGAVMVWTKTMLLQEAISRRSFYHQGTMGWLIWPRMNWSLRALSKGGTRRAMAEPRMISVSSPLNQWTGRQAASAETP